MKAAFLHYWLIDWLIYLDRIAEKQVHAYQGHVPVCACVRAFLYEREREEGGGGRGA